MRAAGLVLALGLALLVAPARAQAPTLDYSTIDRATVRVIAVEGVGTQRYDSQSRRYRLMAVPVAGHGSGLIVSADGIVVTARHVVEDAQLVAIWVPGEARAYAATVVYQDPSVDFAILAMQGTFSSFVPLAPLARTLHVREQVHAIGYPLDARRTDPQSAQGIVSGVLPDGSLQLDISLNPGNSGGPLIDADEHVLGIVVARGAVEEGVQGIGIAVPVQPILAALASEVPSRIDAARAGLPSQDDAAEVAELVRLLVRVGATELIHEILEEMEHHGTSDLFTRLHQLEEQTHDPEIQVLVAAYYWDAAAVILERAGGLMRASEMPVGPDRDLVTDLLTRATRLAYVASRADAELERRSPFVRRILYYFEEPGAAPAAPAAPLMAPVATSPAAVSQASGATASEEPPEPPHDANHDHRIRIGATIDLIGPAHVGGGNAFDGGLTRFQFEWSPITLRAGIFAFDPILGLDVAIGYWSPTFVFQAGAEIGGMIRLGDRYGAVLGASWLPGIIVTAPELNGALGAWRAYVGAQIDDVLVGAGWRGFARDNLVAMHEYELWFSVAVD